MQTASTEGIYTMAIMVDEAIWPYRGTLYAHMMSDQPGQAGLDELHAFAAALGLKRTWFQNKPGHPHYDISQNMRRLAIRKGAQPVTGTELIERNPNRSKYT